MKQFFVVFVFADISKKKRKKTGKRNVTLVTSDSTEELKKNVIKGTERIYLILSKCAYCESIF